MGQPSESSGSSHPSSAAENLRADSRIAEARRLIAEAVADHSRGIQDVRAANPDLSAGYEQLLSRLAETRGGPPFWPYLSSGLGHGPYVELADGSVKLDFIGGIGVHGAGHSHEAMVDAALDAAGTPNEKLDPPAGAPNENVGPDDVAGFAASAVAPGFFTSHDAHFTVAVASFIVMHSAHRH